jgi:hypothetical protein
MTIRISPHVPRIGLGAGVGDLIEQLAGQAR